jgi:alpha-tubulin suppressor-like RCC1 family protein
MLKFNNVILTDIFVANEGQLWTVGQNVYGSLGDGTGGAGTSKSSPVQTIAGGTNWQSLSLGDYAHGGIKSDGTLWAWGRNEDGHLGVGDTTHRSSPTQISGAGTNWSSVSGSYYGGVAIKTNGTLWTWGKNGTSFGSTLGNGSTASTSIPGQVDASTNWIMASGGGYNAMAIAW